MHGLEYIEAVEASVAELVGVDRGDRYERAVAASLARYANLQVRRGWTVERCLREVRHSRGRRPELVRVAGGPF